MTPQGEIKGKENKRRTMSAERRSKKKRCIPVFALRSSICVLRSSFCAYFQLLIEINVLAGDVVPIVLGGHGFGGLAGLLCPCGVVEGLAECAG